MAETDLLQAARSGDEAAFAGLVAPYRRQFRGELRPHLGTLTDSLPVRQRHHDIFFRHEVFGRKVGRLLVRDLCEGSQHTGRCCVPDEAVEIVHTGLGAFAEQKHWRRFQNAGDLDKSRCGEFFSSTGSNFSFAIFAWYFATVSGLACSGVWTV